MTTTTRRSPLPVLPQRSASAEPIATPIDPDAARIGLITLGCDKNTVDSERQLGRLLGAGARVVEDVNDADVIIINTCGFIDAAKEESIDAIMDAVRLKQAGRVRAVVAMGCLVQRYKSELQTEIPEVDLFVGLTEAEQLVPQLRAQGLLPATTPNMERPLRVLSTRTRHTSYLKISEGCDHGCAFCAIPLMRGKHRSTPIGALVREAQTLAAAGVVELNIISQDTTWYGRDLLRGSAPADGDLFVGRTFNGMPNATAAAPSARTDAARISGKRGLLPELLQALIAETTVPWLRLFYMYPSGISRDLVELMAREPRILPYLDMPIQHGSDAVLARMRRPERQATIRERVSWLRAAIPDLSLRTTLIVGFPGETEDDFEQMLELLDEIRFDHLGAFPYSPEESTPASAMADQVPDSVVRERLERLMDLQRTITLERNERWIGRETTALIDALVGRDSDMDERGDGRGAVARTKGQALEIDGVLHIADARGVQPGELVQVRITEALEDDLIGEVMDRSETQWQQ